MKLTAPWVWFLGAGAAIALGAVLWFTAFILWPASVVLIIVGVSKLLREGRPATSPTHPR